MVFSGRSNDMEQSVGNESNDSFSRLRRKEQRFIELAEARTDRIIDALDKLGNLSNKGNYEYAPEDVKKIFRAIERATRDCQRRFTDGTGPSKFKLR